ncbi:MAG: hypothetical protein FJ102_05955 [Deltaproteobacteria bacterium]|nr:hypothetical protein [Deltaproteobacteria bacterium]
MGCFAFWPTPYLDENEAPELERASWDDGEPVTVDGVNDIFFAVAFDPDLDAEAGDSVEFLWQAGPYLVDPREEREEETGDQIYFYSFVELPYDPELNGEMLSVTVYDVEGADDRMSWPLEVL